MGPYGAPTLTEPPYFIASTNPFARILALFCLSTPLMVTVDWVSGLTALVLEVIALAAGGVKFRHLARMAWPILLAAPLASVTMLLYAKPSGQVYFSWWLMNISDNSIKLASAILIRVLALALPAVALFLHTDPTRAADALAQNAKLPVRFVLASLAAVRMTGQLMNEWRIMELARRARGLTDTGKFKRFGQMAFAMLVIAIRRAADLSTAMEARGFGSNPRSWARPSEWRGRDTLTILAGIGIAAVALGAAVWAGTFRWFGL
ncbi:hypothetical protein BSR29_07745 [Boudabousia liubingyangii]|uniref:Energy-coupling factor transporter transmembrane protein EcfT n=1 Tax=Boudabousia liubingyangii TaxID=1921764 RepID=A0A1Q5PJV2_9ACTO|nr:hypothetical protein BSR29_07745 [Boudabousia liubingyangii]OKL46519.1 hypothetical protein BSR28_07040 [Boudabousia liubingyangii]